MRAKKRPRTDKPSASDPPPRSPLPDAPRKLNIRFGGCVHEEHKQPIYSISFYDPLPEVPLDGNGAGDQQVGALCATGKGGARGAATGPAPAAPVVARRAHLAAAA